MRESLEMSIFGSDSDSRLEIVPDGEDRRIKGLVDSTLRRLQDTYKLPQKCLRAVHPKDHGCVEAVFTVSRTLPDDLRVGVFKDRGKSFRAAIRFSTAMSEVVDDAPSQFLGMALKLYDVEGDHLESDDEKRTQDFLMLNLSVFPFANVADFEAESKADVFIRPGAFPEAASRIFQPPPQSPLDSSYFSTVPFQFGKGRAMKFRARPLNPVRGGPGAEIRNKRYLRDALGRRMAGAREAILFDFEVQVRDLKGLDVAREIENASTLWDERSHPFVRVAGIAIQPQDIASNETFCESLFYTPWHGLKAHRPLGGINRARRKVYQASAKQRGCPVSPRLPSAPR